MSITWLEYLEKNENNYNYYRILIYKYIKSNKQIIKDFFYYLDNESEKGYNERYEKYIENIQNDKNYATDFEISTVAIVLKKTIIIYRKETFGYSFYNIYTGDITIENEAIMLTHVIEHSLN